MTREEFVTLAARGPVLLDGATGSNLMLRGRPRGVCAEQWALEHPDIVIALQTEYVQAGSQIIYAPTFGANRVGLGMYDLAGDLAAINRDLVALSRQAAGGRAFVAGDMTTIGKPADYAELIDLYTEQAQALLDADVDLFVIETMMGLEETQAALEAVRMLCELPVLCSLSFAADGQAFFGGGAADAAEVLETLGADAVGVNCSVGPDQMEAMIRTMAAHAAIPILAKPNAGMPEIGDDGSVHYSMDADHFARSMGTLLQAGARIIGGCCGTTPAYIEKLHAAYCAML